MTSKDAVKKHKEVPFNYVITFLNKSPSIVVDLGVFWAFYIDVTLEGARQANNTRYKEARETTEYMLAQTLCLIRLKSKVLLTIYIYDKAVTEYKSWTSAFKHWTTRAKKCFHSIDPFTVTLQAH